MAHRNIFFGSVTAPHNSRTADLCARLKNKRRRLRRLDAAGMAPGRSGR